MVVMEARMPEADKATEAKIQEWASFVTRNRLIHEPHWLRSNWKIPPDMEELARRAQADSHGFELPPPGYWAVEHAIREHLEGCRASPTAMRELLLHVFWERRPPEEFELAGPGQVLPTKMAGLGMTPDRVVRTALKRFLRLME